MKDLQTRAKQIASFVVDNNATVRRTAKAFGIGKSTVHNDLTKRLPFIDMALFLEVREILDKNNKEKSARGGNATKQKFLLLKKSK